MLIKKHYFISQIYIPTIFVTKQILGELSERMQNTANH